MIFLIAESGLFDFDLTFPIEGLLFVALSLVISSSFLTPISKQMDERDNDINFNLRKSIILLNFAYEKLDLSVELLTNEVEELTRQLRLVRNYTSSQFEEEILYIQKNNTILLGELKGDLAIKSAYLFYNIQTSLISLTDTFFNKKFKNT